MNTKLTAIERSMKYYITYKTVDDFRIFKGKTLKHEHTIQLNAIEDNLNEIYSN